MLKRVQHLRQLWKQISLGGGKKNLEKIKSQGKMSPRERIQYLLDPDTSLLEMGSLAGFEMYPEFGGCPAGGTVAGLGYVSGRLCVVLANDMTVKAGAWFPITGKKNLRLQEIAMENH
ncbi:MAG: carboxyl transferase domain-containing protein, partial [Chitinophagaceae bacterium]